MSMIAFAVGLGIFSLDQSEKIILFFSGNVWRFPYLAHKHGGGSFLLAYFIFFLFTAIPMFLMEAALGQYYSMGALEIWQAFPILKGVGYGNLALAGFTVCFYHVIIGWALYYLIIAFQNPFPWQGCKESW